ncbi:MULTISPECIES: 5-deoxy-glucuronate isomerase [unclassified Methylobacterium]|jgi:5-deoxy-glucuronate isomerase|uniref:5-deoxy-glucuronate isomerase n=1 Tax=unclassified Methylobacterium TaxID=2615210 RepID=UPI001353E86B|nr:5-deoxy-glucuronate isomerase [Methylobacterium sp. 2A]MWV23470.1 5-deoxy-glucuronate isomerase [Methylobacterium sp. 2A]
MPDLLVRPHDPDAEGCVLRVTPASAGWSHVGFAVHRLSSGATASGGETGREACLVMVSGRARIRAGSVDFGLVGGRASPFEGPPDSVHVPAGLPWRVEAEGAAEVAVCTAPGMDGSRAPRAIPAAEVALSTRGTGTNLRHVRDILPETREADGLLVVEVVTPGGHWSSYPPHKHDRDLFPQETRLEETYYHRLHPPQGFALQRVYTDDRAIDAALVVEDGCVVLVPRGHHPVAAAHGYDLWYLNVMAGPVRRWRVQPDHAHAWLLDEARDRSGRTEEQAVPTA